jgi:hypothetical protein
MNLSKGDVLETNGSGQVTKADVVLLSLTLEDLEIIGKLPIDREKFLEIVDILQERLNENFQELLSEAVAEVED